MGARWSRWIAAATALSAAVTLLVLGSGYAPWLTLVLGIVAIGSIALLLIEHSSSDREQRTWSELVNEAEQDLAEPPSPVSPRSATITERLRSVLRSLERERDAQARDGAQREWLLGGLDQSVFLVSRQGRVVGCNQAACDFVGVPEARIVGRAIDEIFTHRELLDLFGSAREEFPVRSRVRIPTAEGERIVEVSIAIPARKDPSSNPSSNARPASSETNLPRAIITMRDATEQARAVQVKSDFVAAASHELRTPIATLKTALETLEDGAKDDVPMRDRLLRTIATQSDRLEEMVRDLLDLSRLESPEARVETRPVSLTELRESLAATFARVCAERSLRLDVQTDPLLERAQPRSDPRLLRLILQNLIENATKFAYESTTIRVTISPLASPPLWDAPVHAPDASSHSRGGLRLEVADEGIGIPLAHQQRIFERYYQVDSARTGMGGRRGTGLGLAIVKHAVRSLGGVIRVQSVWKQGTTMIVELPPPGSPMQDEEAIPNHP